MGLFSSISSFVKKVVTVAAPIAATVAAFTPVGAAVNVAARTAGAVGIKTPFQRFLAGFGAPGLPTPTVATPGIFPAGAFGPPAPVAAPAPQQFCPQPAAVRPAPVRRGFGFSIFGPRPSFPQQAVSPGFVRPTFRAFQPIFSPSGQIQNTANGMFQFQRAPGISPLAANFAGFGGKFTPFGSFNRRVTPPQRAALFPPVDRESGRQLFSVGAQPVKPFIPFLGAGSVPARASFITPVVKERLDQPDPLLGRAAALQLAQSSKISRAISSFRRRRRRF